MGKKIQCIGRYAMDGVTLGKGSFASVELATHALVNAKVSFTSSPSASKQRPLKSDDSTQTRFEYTTPQLLLPSWEPVTAKFHYAILVAERSEAGRRPASWC